MTTEIVSAALPAMLIGASSKRTGDPFHMSKAQKALTGYSFPANGGGIADRI